MALQTQRHRYGKSNRSAAYALDRTFHQSVIKQFYQYRALPNSNALISTPADFVQKAPALFELIYQAEHYVHIRLERHATFPRIWRYRRVRYRLHLSALGQLFVFDLQGRNLITGVVPYKGAVMPTISAYTLAFNALMASPQEVAFSPADLSDTPTLISTAPQLSPFNNPDH